MVLVSKTSVRATVPRVRIPPSPLASRVFCEHGFFLAPSSFDKQGGNRTRGRCAATHSARFDTEGASAQIPPSPLASRVFCEHGSFFAPSSFDKQGGNRIRGRCAATRSLCVCLGLPTVVICNDGADRGDEPVVPPSFPADSRYVRHLAEPRHIVLVRPSRENDARQLRSTLLQACD